MDLYFLLFFSHSYSIYRTFSYCLCPLVVVTHLMPKSFCLCVCTLVLPFSTHHQQCAACCRWPCFGRRVGLDDPQRSLPTPTILWFCDSVSLLQLFVLSFFDFQVIEEPCCSDHLKQIASLTFLQSFKAVLGLSTHLLSVVYVMFFVAAAVDFERFLQFFLVYGEFRLFSQQGSALHH